MLQLSRCQKLRKEARFEEKNIIFRQGNAPAPKGALAMRKIQDLENELLDHPPFSPDLSHLDFLVFRNLKKFVSGSRFALRLPGMKGILILVRLKIFHLVLLMITSNEKTGDYLLPISSRKNLLLLNHNK